MSDDALRLVVHPNWAHRHQDLLSAFRGFRNGITTGVRIRMPYIIQAVVYAAVYRDGMLWERVKFVLKQAFQHGRNLGLFVGIYKSICFALRKFGVDGGLESWIAGFIGGYYAFGDSKGVSGSVNTQIVLYLFSRSLYGFFVAASNTKKLPSSLDVQTEHGFRCFAGLSLAMVLYLTEYQPGDLKRSFMNTMNFLYYDSDLKGQRLLPPKRFLIFFIVVTASMFQMFNPNLQLPKLYQAMGLG